MYIKGQIGKTVRQLRHIQHLTLKEISPNHSTLCHIEAGREEPTLAYCEKLSSRLNIHLGQLISTSQTSQPIILLDDFTLEVAKYAKHLSPRNRKIIIEVLLDLDSKKVT